MTPYWNRMATYGWSTVVSEGRVPPDALDDVAARREARAEIDAVVAKLLFGLTADELDFILDTFPVLRRREERRHGEFLTKRRVMEWYEKV
jgi:hypothetical protein